MRGLYIFVLLCVAFCIHAQTDVDAAKEFQSDKKLNKIVFGSCNKHDRPQPAWAHIVDLNPDLFIWLGDTVYADNVLKIFLRAHASLQDIEFKLNAQKERPEYRRLLQSDTKIIGVWDDHDYGKNDGGAEYPNKQGSQQLFLDFLDEPKDSPRWNREGIYGSFSFGPKGQKIKVILLDVRYHKEGTHGAGDLLGEDQWAWLENELADSDAQIHLIGSGIQILPADKPLSEKWANHPQSRYRLFRLLKQKQTPGVIFLSGDVHYAEKMKVDVNCSDLGYPVYEFTSSGLTHSCDANVPNCNFFINKFFKHMYHLEHFFAKRNFGSIDIDWDASPATITVQAHDAVNGSVVWQEKIRLSDLTFRSNEDPNETLKIQQCEINVPKYYILPMFGIYAIVLKVVASILILILFIGTVRSLLRSRKEGRKQKKE